MRAVSGISTENEQPTGTTYRHKATTIFCPPIISAAATRRGLAAAAFEIHYEAELLKLRDEIQAGRYRPQPSITFLVEWPTLREVFAAMFRDRIVQTWIAQRIEPLSRRSSSASFQLPQRVRVRFAAVKHLHEAIREKSENYTRDCWVLKYDLKGSSCR